MNTLPQTMRRFQATMTYSIPAPVLDAIGGTPLTCELPRVEPLPYSATISIKADSYEAHTAWWEMRGVAGVATIQGFPIWQCLSPVSGSVYTVSYAPRLGFYTCDCKAGQKGAASDTEPRCWHLCLFNRLWLPGIMADRRTGNHTGILTTAELEADHRQETQEMDEESGLAIAQEQLEAEFDNAIRSAKEKMAFYHATNRATFASRDARTLALKAAQDGVDSSVNHRHDVERRLNAVRSRLSEISGKAVC